MAVILTDMEMPKHCHGCEFGRRFDNASTFCERKPMEQRINDWDEIPKWCPLLPEDDLQTTEAVPTQVNVLLTPEYYSCKECFAELWQPMLYCWHCGRKIIWKD